MVVDEKTLRKLQYFLAEQDKISDERRGYQRSHIIDTDPNAPLCINCKYCQQKGFLFHCPIFELPEDGKVVGLHGIVYYRRKDRKPKTYPNVPLKNDECEIFEPLLI